MVHVLKTLFLLTIPVVTQGAPIDRARMRVAEEAMREREEVLAPSYSIYYAPAPCPRLVRDVLKKFAEIDGQNCRDLELLPCTDNGSVTLTVTDRPRWQPSSYLPVSGAIMHNVEKFLKTENVGSSLLGSPEKLAQIADLSEGKYADILQICVPKTAGLPKERGEKKITLTEASFKSPGSELKIYRYSPLNPAHEQVYTKEFSALMARILGARRKEQVSDSQKIK